MTNIREDRKIMLDIMSEEINESVESMTDDAKENPLFGEAHFYMFEDKRSFDDMSHANDDRHSEELLAVVKKHKDNGVKDDLIFEALKDSVKIDVQGVFIPNNAVESWRLGEEEYQFQELSELDLADEEREYLSRKLNCYWDKKSDFVYVDMSYDVIWMTCDPAKLNRNINELKKSTYLKTRYIPENSNRISSLCGEVDIYVYKTTNDKPAAVCYFGKRSIKPTWSYRFNDDSQRMRKINEALENAKERQDRKLKELIESQSRKNELKAGLKVGDIVVANWGYSMSIVDFAAIREIKGTKLIVEELQNELAGPEESYNNIAGTRVIAGHPTGKLMRMTIGKYGLKSGGHHWSTWDKKPQYENHND